MSTQEPAAKRGKADSSEEYTLVYWPGIPGRGEPIRLAFEEAKVPYTDRCNEDKGAVKELAGMLRADNDKPDDNVPVFAPPVLLHGDVVLSQLPNILFYLGPRLGLAPDDELSRLRINQVTLTALDLQNEIHDVHHPVAVGDYYENQKTEALTRSKDLRANRFPKFFGYFERVLDNNKAGGGEYLVGSRLSIADLVVFHIVDGALYAFPKRMAALLPKHPKLEAHYNAIKERPHIKSYLASDRRVSYGNGLYRAYPELDGDE